MNKFLILLLSISMLAFFGCSEDEKDVNEFEVLVNYLEGEDGGYMNNMGSWIMKAGVLDQNFDYSAYTVLDLRSQDVFDAKHIEGAIRTDMTDMFDYAANSTKPILVTCYSGQQASYAHMLLRLKGYEAYVMMFGMSVEADTAHPTMDYWTKKCTDTYASNLVNTESPNLPSFDFPVLNTGFDDPAEILDARINAAIAAWGSLLKPAKDVIESPDDYNIMNYWGTTDSFHSGNPYTTLGHIEGAYQLIPRSLKKGENLNAFNPDPLAKNIFYCWTGQTAAAAIAYLYVIGYENVYSISYGYNSINWSGLSGHKWSKPFGE